LTRTASRAPGSTITSPAATSPARITASTDEDTTVREVHLDRERGMSGTRTAGNAPADHRVCVGAGQDRCGCPTGGARDRRLASDASSG
jgi:hypothetical protein